ncbi:hypothetical protein [Bombilactobacillus thymidiniphilus]|uniref:Uncharacterized protein n=1 Tax=Bombilactobacillus thymidiniphilus TaxID=2923363 RepID=A0ABY4PB60_9LACO|nr:hypothetical protein [Bombilactobacillus thymidiniphilus]UQS83013.1 hypothetical protein MOO47_04315 [Bombilactobacillus thymidiniphilus]
MQKLRNSIIIMFLLVPIYSELALPSNNNVCQARTHSIKPKQTQKKSVSKIKIGKIYSDPYGFSCIKFIDKCNYVVLLLNGNPESFFRDGESYPLEFYIGKYTRKGSKYILHKDTNQHTSIYFLDMKRFRKKQYSDIDGPGSNYTNPKDKSYSMIMYLKNGKYYVRNYYDSKRSMGSYQLRHYPNHIGGVKNSTFPNNAQEFLSNFTYISRDRVRDLSSKGK